MRHTFDPFSTQADPGNFSHADPDIFFTRRSRQFFTSGSRQMFTRRSRQFSHADPSRSTQARANRLFNESVGARSRNYHHGIGRYIPRTPLAQVHTKPPGSSSHKTPWHKTPWLAAWWCRSVLWLQSPHHCRCISLHQRASRNANWCCGTLRASRFCGSSIATVQSYIEFAQMMRSSLEPSRTFLNLLERARVPFAARPSCKVVQYRARSTAVSCCRQGPIPIWLKLLKLELGGSILWGSGARGLGPLWARF